MTQILLRNKNALGALQLSLTTNLTWDKYHTIKVKDGG
jgi:hypothetical protein